MSKKGVRDFFLFCLDLELLIKKCKKQVCRNQVSLIFANNSRSKQNKKCAKFQQKILNCGVVGAHHSFEIFRQNTWFLEDNRALSNFLYGILHYLISNIKL